MRRDVLIHLFMQILSLSIFNLKLMFSADILEGCSPVWELLLQITLPDYRIQFYEWDFGNGDCPFLSDPSYTYMNQGVYTVSLIVTNDQGCLIRW